MVRIALFLLALPSLLMPPGVCVCQYARTDRVTPTPMPGAVVGQVSSPSDAGVSRPGGCCKKCRTATPPIPRQTDSADRQGQPAHRSPADREHAPNCPAVGPSATAKVVEPPVLLPELRLVATVCPVDTVAVPTVTRVAPADTPFPPTPRYISFRSLLI